MTGAEMEQFRKRMRMDQVRFAALLGFTGTSKNNGIRVKKYEKAAEEPIPKYIAQLIYLMGIFLAEHGRFPNFPHWGYYKYDHSPDPIHQEEADAEG